jgi:hypothetical protein
MAFKRRAFRALRTFRSFRTFMAFLQVWLFGPSGSS